VRLIKMLGIAAMLAFALTAFVGATSSSAAVKKTVLCKKNEKLCSSANLWGTDVKITAHSEKAVLLGSLPVTCLSTAIILAQSSHVDRILGLISALTWTSCSGCSTVTTTTLPSGSLFPTSAGNGKLETTSTTSVLLKGCTVFNIECTATANTATLEFKGGTIGGTAKAIANEVPVGLSGGLCGSSGKWDAGSAGSSPYVVTEVNGSKSGEIWLSPESHA
jgi:uncharacterized protein YceK